MKTVTLEGKAIPVKDEDYEFVSERVSHVLDNPLPEISDFTEVVSYREGTGVTTKKYRFSGVPELQYEEHHLDDIQWIYPCTSHNILP